MVIKNEQVLEAAARVLSRRPNATLQSIADAAGISRTTIFHKYPTRDELLEALATDTMTRIGDAMAQVPQNADEDVPEALERITRGLMPLGPRAAFLRLAPGDGSALDSHWERAATPLAIYMGLLQSAGHLRADQPTRWLVAAYLGLVFAAWDEVSVGALGQEDAVSLVVGTWLTGSRRPPILSP